MLLSRSEAVAPLNRLIGSFPVPNVLALSELSKYGVGEVYFGGLRLSLLKALELDGKIYATLLEFVTTDPVPTGANENVSGFPYLGVSF